MILRIRDNRGWLLLGLLVITCSGFGVRWGTNLLQKDNVRDEYLMRVPIDNILNRGWSIETAIDYQEVKGPTFFWSYAAACELIGGDINDMRLVSVWFYIGGGLLALLLALLAGVHGWALPSVAALYVLLPYNLPQGQLLMSEASFVCFAGLTTLAFVWGFGDRPESQRRVWGPIVFGIALSVLFHHRPHAVALAGAAAIVSLSRDGVRCWPWLLACVAAGLSRLPLWIRWGGLVTSDYQGIFGLGLCLECLTYLLIVLLPVTGVFLWGALADRDIRSGWKWTAGGAAVGVLLGVVAMPDLDERLEFTVRSTGEVIDVAAFAGVVATTLKAFAPAGLLRTALLLVLSAAGGASFGAFAQHVLTQRAWNRAAVFCSLAFWTLATGLALYGMTRGPIYDRYVLVWLLLMPVVWVLTVPRWLLWAQAILFAAINAYFIRLYFI